MKTHRRRARRILSRKAAGVMGAAVACLVLGLAQAQTVEEQPATFRVHPEVTYQTMTGFGAGYYQNSLDDINAVKAEDRDQVYELLYGEKGVRLNIVRFHISWSAEPLPEGHPLRAQGLHYNWENDLHTQNVWKAIAPILKRTKPIIYAVPFTAPGRWKTNQQPNFGGSVLPEYYRHYAEYLADFVDYYRKVLHVDIGILSPQNEPDVAVYWESCRWTGTELRDFLNVLGPTFRARGLETKFMLSEGSTWDQAWIRLEPTLRDPAARVFLNIMASHSYGDDDLVDNGRALFRAASGKHGIPVWMSEMSLIGLPDDPSMWSALRIAHYMYRDIVEAHASAWIYCFSIFTSKFPGSMGVLSPAKEGELVVPKRFWTFANYSHFVRPGWTRMQIDGISFANTGFVNPERSRFVIVALNASANGRPATYDFGDWTIAAVEAYRTSKDLDLARVEAPTLRAHAFNVTLAPLSVTTLVGELRRGPTHGAAKPEPKAQP